MLALVSLGLAIVSAMLSIPLAVLFVEVIASLNPVDETIVKPTIQSKRVAVVVPAHDEGTGLVPTLDDIKPQLQAWDRLIVVADNCTDDTASVATAAGANVIERKDLNRIGKGYALSFAIEYLTKDPPDFVIFIDADCRIQSNMIDGLRSVCNDLNRPIQACFLMKSPENSPIDHSVAQFAWIIKNWVRPLGLRALGCPVQLMGTGMIFPWSIIRSMPLASGNIVEDLKLGLDLAAAGNAPHFFPFVIGTSEFPVTEKGTQTQRHRWVMGHLTVIATVVPRLFLRGLIRGDVDSLVLALDMAVPPLSLFGLLLVSMLLLDGIALACGLSPAPFTIAAGNLVMFTLAISMAWLKFGRDVLPIRAVGAIASALLGRLSLYRQIFLHKSETQWVRTERAPPGGDKKPPTPG